MHEHTIAEHIAREEKLKAMAESPSPMSYGAGAAIGGAYEGYQAQCGERDARAPGIRERVQAQIAEAARTTERINTLRELNSLFEMNPDVARILDLLEESRLMTI